MNGDFWDRLIAGHTATTVPSAVDQRLAGKGFGEAFEGVRALTDKGREAAALELPVASGTKVSFKGTLGSYRSMDDPPAPGVSGEVVTVRSAGGDVTSHEGLVFVKWADGKFRPVHAEFLTAVPTRPLTAAEMGSLAFSAGNVRMHAASLGDLTSFLKVAEGTLIHKSTKDLWTFNKDADGNLLVERLFDGNGDPLKG